MTVLILEDNEFRYALMVEALASMKAKATVQRYVGVGDMIRAFTRGLGQPWIVSLDLDLSSSPLGPSAGSGFQVVDHLLTKQPFAPVIIHSSLKKQGELLVDKLRLKGWNATSIPLREEEDMPLWADRIVELMEEGK